MLAKILIEGFRNDVFFVMHELNQRTQLVFPPFETPCSSIFEAFPQHLQIGFHLCLGKTCFDLIFLVWGFFFFLLHFMSVLKILESSPLLSQVEKSSDFMDLVRH